MNVLSLFDGKSSGYTALELIGVTPTNYYSSEIDKYAIQVSDAIHPNQTRLGDVTKWREWDIDWYSIDLILGGFPCPTWSRAGKQQGDKDERGMLFWVVLDIMKHVRSVNPKADFLIENVKMKKEFEGYITHHMTEAVGTVHKILINSALVSAQNRNRYYWTSWKNCQPEDRGLLAKDIISQDCETIVVYNRKDGVKDQIKEKLLCLSASDWRGLNRNQNQNCVITKEGEKRALNPIELFRAQTVPERYIDKILACGVSNTQLYKIAGNGWTDEVIAHLLRARYK